MRIKVILYLIIVEVIFLWAGNYLVEAHNALKNTPIYMHALGWPPALVFLALLCKDKSPDNSDQVSESDPAQ